MERIATFGLMICFCGHLLTAQEFQFDSVNWKVIGEQHIEDVVRHFEGRQSIYLFRTTAEVKDFDFFTGEIQFDIFVNESRGFPGLMFRMTDEDNYEEFYIRPHQSGNPDANQYTPVFNGRGGWQLYYGEGFSKPVKYKMDAWNTVKLVIAESDGEVYINDMETPLFYIPELKQRNVAGKVGLRSSGPSGFQFSNFKVKKEQSPNVKSRKQVSFAMAPEVVTRWMISEPFKENQLEGVYALSDKDKKQLQWSPLKVENKGYANINRLVKVSPDQNTVYAKLVIESNADQVKKLSFGFSDRVRVYLNDEIIMSAQDNYASRDYRYLGTVGFFDEVYLRLKEGRNELWMAVSENFGGWGIMAKFDDLSGIELRD